MAVTRQKLLRFQKARNKSGFPSNLQFQIDANASGFKVSELGEVRPFTVDGIKGYLWEVPTDRGRTRVVEFVGRIHIEGEPWPFGDQWIPGFTTADVFKLLDAEATFLVAQAD